MPPSIAEFLREWVASGLVASERAESIVRAFASTPLTLFELEQNLVQAGHLTAFQARAILQGKGKSLLLGNYAILERLGAGAMGVVFLAEHRRMRRRVAVKVLPPKAVRDADAVERFHREVQAVARLSHPNIVTAHDADEAKGIHYLVMEYVDGEDLSSLLRKSGPIPIPDAVECTLQAARGLAYAHERGVVHRDVKPSNLLLTIEGTIKILDMGLACLSDSTGVADHGLTGTGVIMGTLDYMAPEQGINARNADARSDIYSLGCTLHFLLTARPVFAGETPVEKVLAHRDQPIPDLQQLRPDCPAGLESVFRRMVAKSPDRRFQSMAEVVTALEILVGAETFAEAPLSGSQTDSALLRFLEQRQSGTKPAGGVQVAEASRGRDATDDATRPDTLDGSHLQDTLAFPRSLLKPLGRVGRSPRGRKILIGVTAVFALTVGAVFIGITAREKSIAPPDLARDSKPAPAIDPSNSNAAGTPSGARPSAAPSENKPQRPLKAETVRADVSDEPAVAEVPVIPVTVSDEPVGPKTIRVGTEKGMVATLTEAVVKANGGDTIEIATDEPLPIQEPLSWNQPGTLTIRAAAGKRPILLFSQASQKEGIEFGRVSELFASSDDSITLSGLILVDMIPLERTLISSQRSIKVADTICLTRFARFLSVSSDAAETTLERCYQWKRRVNVTVPMSLCTLSSDKVAFRQCLFAGSSSMQFRNNTQEIHSEHVTFLGTAGAWQITNRQMELTSDRSLYVGLDWVAIFNDLNTGTDAARVAEARARLTQYRGTSNTFFQCLRFAPQFSAKAEADLVEWQSLTRNGEISPQFVDPQFVRPELVSLTPTKTLPPAAFALKPTSPLRKQKGFGCDTTLLPEFPARLLEALPADARHEGP